MPRNDARIAQGDWIQYHNTDQREEQPPSKGPRGRIFWTANRSLSKGTRVWLIAGKSVARRKLFTLHGWFTVDRTSIDADGIRYASGPIGERFCPAIDLNDEEWFREFQRYMGNFGRGLSPLRVEDLEHLQRLADLRRRVARRAGRSGA